MVSPLPSPHRRHLKEAQEQDAPKEDREHRHRRSRRTHPSSDKHRHRRKPDISSPSSGSTSESSSEDSYSDDDVSTEDDRRRKKTSRTKRERRKHGRKKDGKGKESRRESRKERRKKRRRHSDDSDSSDDEDRKKKRRLLKEAKAMLKKHRSLSDGSNGRVSSKGTKELSEEDYYEKNKEFSTWLTEERRIYFSNLSSEEARTLFQDFVGAWNEGNLPKKYYEGIDKAPRTSHKWEIKKDQDHSVDREEELEFMRKLEKAQRRKFQKEQDDVLDELLPKATGREKLLEKRNLRREQARGRDDSPELMKEHDIMGGGDDFKQRLAKGHAQRERKAAERTQALKEKQSAFEEKETAAMDQLRALVNVAGGKITIPKRQDPFM